MISTGRFADVGRGIRLHYASACDPAARPMLVLWGEADTAPPLTLLEGLSELVGDLTIERLPGATHWLAHEEPERIASAIHAFCGASWAARLPLDRTAGQRRPGRWQNRSTLRLMEQH